MTTTERGHRKKTMKSIESKKGLTLADAFPAVLTVAIIAITFVAVIYTFVQFQTGLNQNIATTVVNESTSSPVTEAGYLLSNSSACGSNYAAVTVINATSANLITAGNYTVNSTLGSIAFKTGIGNTNIYNNTKWNITYTYTYAGSACVAAGSFTTQFSNQIALVGLVLTIILIAIVIGVLVTSFFMRRRGRA